MKNWIIPITIVCIICGLLISLQFKVQNSLSTNPIGQRNEILVGIINKLEKEIKDYQETISTFKKEIEEIETRKATGQNNIKELQEKVQKAKFLAGLTPVKGKGIKVILDDNKKGLKASPNDDPNRYIIHYENLLNIITELKLGNAEAISINDQRIVTPSEIRCVGNVILVNTTRLAPPFIIKAIGDPDFLEYVLVTGEYDLLKNAGFPVNYEKFSSGKLLEIPAYSGTYRFNYAKTVEK